MEFEPHGGVRVSQRIARRLRNGIALQGDTPARHQYDQRMQEMVRPASEVIGVCRKSRRGNSVRSIFGKLRKIFLN